MTKNNITLNYSPRVPFLKFHQRHQKRAVLVCHRRAGKTVATIHDLIIKAARTKKPNGFYAYIAPQKNQVKQIAWDYLVRAVRPFGNIVKINNQELLVQLPNGAKIRLFGADDPDSFRGLYFDGVVLDEFGDMRPRLYTEVIQPTLADRDGWAVFIGTPKGHNEFYKIREKARQNSDKYFYLELRASETGFVADEQLKDAREEMTDSEYQQEYECSFEASLQGSYYANQIAELEAHKQLTDIPYLEDEPVHLAADLGYSDSTSIWFYQLIAGQVRIIDFLEVERTKLTDIVDMLREKEYKYGICYLPHDATHQRLGTEKTIVETLWNFGFEVRSLPRLAIRDGINAVRKVLRACWFDYNNCYHGLEHLRMYEKMFNKQTNMYIDKPRHDKHSHAADAFRYLALSIREDDYAVEVQPHEKIEKAIPKAEVKKVDLGNRFTIPAPWEQSFSRTRSIGRI